MTIHHLSPSSLCLYRAEPALWIIKYLKGVKDKGGPKMWRGSAVEAGLDAFLYGHTDHQARAANRFEIEAQGDLSPHVQAQRILIEPMLLSAIQAVGRWTLPVPTARQFPIEYRFGGAIEWPVIGYVDYLYPEYLVDLKTTEKIPSKPKPDHRLQVSLYAEATGRPAKLLYVSAKRHEWYDVKPEDQAEDIAEARQLAHKIAKVVRQSPDPRHWLQIFPANDINGYRWSDETRQIYLNEQAA